jgi:hypothetical protein
MRIGVYAAEIKSQRAHRSGNVPQFTSILQTQNNSNVIN